VNWLKDGGFIDVKHKPTELFVTLKKYGSFEFATLILWLNLCSNSSICNWYSQLEIGKYSRDDLECLLQAEFSNITSRSRSNALSSLLGTLKSTLLSSYFCMCTLGIVGKNIKSLSKSNSQNVEPTALLYSIYQFAMAIGSYSFTLSQLIDRNDKTASIHELGINESQIKKMLLGLQEHRSRLVRVEFNANLDNIFINKDYTATEALKAYLEGK
ncbi:MAG: hypothetical protein PHO32_02355, partial [Candidatus Cloacimonetes bacterium]|nr:hypothetical protein [Candidatus Cloacimonadota bacterium]